MSLAEELSSYAVSLRTGMKVLGWATPSRAPRLLPWARP